jgi:hypothetical protein
LSVWHAVLALHKRLCAPAHSVWQWVLPGCHLSMLLLRKLQVQREGLYLSQALGKDSLLRFRMEGEVSSCESWLRGADARIIGG